MRRHWWWVLGLVLVGGGLALAVFSRPGPADFGWTSYTPLSADSEPLRSWEDGWFVSSGQLAGFGLAALGLVVVAAGIGFMLGRRARREEQP